MKNNIKAVLFDLDGTLLNTAPEIIAALNTTLVNHCKPILPYKKARQFISRGSEWLIKYSFNINESHFQYEALLKRFLDSYHKNLGINTKPFTGIPSVIKALNQKNILWGIVTNKPTWLTKPLIKEIKFCQTAACVINGDTLPQNKPEPEQLLYACDLLKIKPFEAIYIGDAHTDVIAGKRAGMSTLVATYGYISPNENLYGWQADGYINHPKDINNWLALMNSRQVNL